MAFTRENDLYALELATGREIRYATDGSLRQKLTHGRKWKTQTLWVDERAKMVYFTSCGELSTRIMITGASYRGSDAAVYRKISDGIVRNRTENSLFPFGFDFLLNDIQLLADLDESGNGTVELFAGVSC